MYVYIFLATLKTTTTTLHFASGKIPATMDSKSQIMSSSSSSAAIASDDKKELNLPFGYRFDPTDEELVKFYLTPKLKGQKLPSEYIMDLDDVYKYDPTNLPFMNQFKHTRVNEAFFFTKDLREEIQIRTTPNGYWKVYQEKVAIVDVADEVIGFKTKLFFHDLYGNITDWKMTKFRCAFIPTTTTTNMENCIVCKIKLRMKEKMECLVEGISEDENNNGINGSN